MLLLYIFDMIFSCASTCFLWNPCDPCSINSLLTCIEDVKCWMAQSFLQQGQLWNHIQCLGPGNLCDVLTNHCSPSHNTQLKTRGDQAFSAVGCKMWSAKLVSLLWYLSYYHEVMPEHTLVWMYLYVHCGLCCNVIDFPSYLWLCCYFWSCGFVIVTISQHVLMFLNT